VIKTHSIRLTDYKAQGQTFSAAALDLKNHPTIKGRDSCIFGSFYVQLSRLISLQGLRLLQNIQTPDATFQPYNGMFSEISRLQDLERQAMAKWRTIVNI
jgi:hypothetical protein